MRADHSAIDDRGGVVDVDSELAKDLRPDILLRPVTKAIVDRLPIPKALRQVAPLNAGTRSKDDRVDEQPIALGSLTSLRAPREERLQLRPLGVGQRVSMHEQL